MSDNETRPGGQPRAWQPALIREPATPYDPEPGPVETGVADQISRLMVDGLVTQHHAARVQLAMRAARDVDQSAGKGAPSGRANLLRVMNEILAELPALEVQSTTDLDRVLEAMSTFNAGDPVAPFIPGAGDDQEQDE